MTDSLDDVTAALYAERFGRPVRTRNSLDPPAEQRKIRRRRRAEVTDVVKVDPEPGAWDRLHQLRGTAGDAVKIPTPREATA